MKLAQYVSEGKPKVGIVEGDLVYDAGESSIDQVLSKGLLNSIRERARSIMTAGEGVPLDSVLLLSPIRYPEKIFCVAENYRSHVRESDSKAAAKPYLFTKFRNSIIGPNDPIVIPRISQEVDWEAELAVVIGKEGKHISEDLAMGYVAGYCISNDVSFRDLQFPEGWPKVLSRLGQNWVLGKGLDGALPLGPWLVTADEIPDPHNLGISLSLNWQVKQNSNTGDMIFSVASLISYISAGITLRPGDIISTGTPEGVAAFTDQRYLKTGDVVEARIDRIGSLRNPVVAET